MKNPYTLTFGKEPENMIVRTVLSSEIISEFNSDSPAYQACMITGVRGSGKTVMLTSIINELKEDDTWITLDLNPERDLLQAFAAELSNRRDLFQIFTDAKINLSLLGLGIEIDGVPPITDIVVALGRMLSRLTENGKRIVVAIDEVSSNKNVREFISQFQIFMREDLNVFLLMTGLYENIYELQNEKTLTFLYRTPKIDMIPLNINRIAENYEKELNVSKKEAKEMAVLTKGYPFAFQVLGYLCYKTKKKYVENIFEFDRYMEEYVYDKIWSELSEKDKVVMKAIGDSSDNKVESIRKICHMDSNTFNVYRKRLIHKGVAVSNEYGRLELTLPRFDHYMNENVYL